MLTQRHDISKTEFAYDFGSNRVFTMGIVSKERDEADLKMRIRGPTSGQRTF